MRLALLAAIRMYQRYISPYKGFRCAYRVHMGGASCSALGYRTVRRYGVIRGTALLRMRTRRCATAHERCASSRRAPAGQRGSCDAGCDLPGCDLPDCGRVLEFADCCDCSPCDKGKGGNEMAARRRQKLRSGGARKPPPDA